jgi:hypothetical protein
MKKLLVIAIAATIYLLAATAFSQEVTVEVESKTAPPGQTVFLRVMLDSDIPISALRVPLMLENPWITLEDVSFEYTVAEPYFIDSTLLSDTNRTDVINILPYIQSPLPTIPPPGGEICRLIITVDPLAPEQFVSVDSLNTPYFWVDASNRYGTSIRPDFVPGGILVNDEATAVEEEEVAIPGGFTLEQNYPNPFNPTTQIAFELPASTTVSLEIYDLLGRPVETLISGNLSAGRHLVKWNSQGNPSGVYFYRLVTPEFSASRKMLLLR